MKYENVHNWEKSKQLMLKFVSKDFINRRKYVKEFTGKDKWRNGEFLERDGDSKN